ncbi:DegT/DnrJ/EryC1/StrS family aminotransferase [Pseudodesulfovibrio sp.]|uniref:DegT/DnrJ/EryC1/StrS family aminotransferase n=1 Tax=unclassified Pseudodesulfovibrio TaxID=2661612 RepID=UPI003B00F90B
MIIPFPASAQKRYVKLLEQVFDSGFLSEGGQVDSFEEEFQAMAGLPSVAVCNGGAALYMLFAYADVAGGEVIVPANTFYATARAAQLAGGDVIYADSNRQDLCISLEDVKRKVTAKTKAVCVVHIGGHIAFDIDRIAAFCRDNDLTLIEDCAHSHGATYNGRHPGSWGLGGAYSFYATKTMPTGEGGMVVSTDTDFLEWARKMRNYGKRVENGKVHYDLDNGFNFRMNEITAALGRMQLERLPEILHWKRALAAKFDTIFQQRVTLPEGMVSGYYKYIVFDYDLKETTGQVFAQSDFGPEIEGIQYDLPGATWIAAHHRCAPIWYGWEHADKSADELAGLLLGS